MTAWTAAGLPHKLVQYYNTGNTIANQQTTANQHININKPGYY